MDVIVNNLTSTVELASGEALLDPVLLRRIVRAVVTQLRDEEATRRWEAQERIIDRRTER
jgi:hypothetical protein